MSRCACRSAFGLISLLVACSGSDGVGPPPPPPPPPAEPGPIAFDIVAAPDVEHGGVLLTVLGGAVDSVTGLAGYEVFHTITPTGARAMVFGSIVTGAFVRVWVPDVSRAAAYSVRVDEGAARRTYAIVPAASYEVTRRP